MTIRQIFGLCIGSGVVALVFVSGCEIYAIVPGDQIGGGSTNYMSTTNALGEVFAAGSAAEAQARTNLGIMGTGANGTNGTSGTNGIQGATGSAGSTGASGTNGINATTTSVATSTSSGLAPYYSAPVISTASRSLVTTNTAAGFQISPTCAAHVSYTVTTTTTATIGGTSAGSVALQWCSTNSTNSASWTTVSTVGNSQAITLAVALQSVQSTTAPVCADVPIGYYLRLLSTGSGTYTNTFNSGVEEISATGY
jgi:hypothetical protein